MEAEKIFTRGNADRTKVTYSEMIKVIADYIRVNPDAEYEWFRDHSQSMTIDELNEYLKNGGKVGTNPYKNSGDNNSAQPSGNGTTQPSGNNTADPTVEAEPDSEPEDVAAMQAKIREEGEKIYERLKGRTFVPQN